MARLIDADELLEKIDAERKYLIERGQTGAEHILVHNFRDLVLNAPTVEPKKGKWVSVCRGKQCNCSVCDERYDHTYEFIENWNFCPNCGADMRGEKRVND